MSEIDTENDPRPVLPELHHYPEDVLVEHQMAEQAWRARETERERLAHNAAVKQRADAEYLEELERKVAAAKDDSLISRAKDREIARLKGLVAKVEADDGQRTRGH